LDRSGREYREKPSIHFSNITKERSF
jgi:hypothetical protein